ncbi:MAG: ABC transporter ATP-binding protein [Actinomycetales bacterium]
MTHLVPNGAARPAAVAVRGLSWRPLGRLAPTLRDLDLTLQPGERLLVVGPSGAGKSTLLRALAGLLETADAGERTGEVLVDGVTVTGDGAAAAPQSVAGRVGLVLQEPGRSVVAATVGRDVAFGPENLGLPRPEIATRVTEALAAVAFPYGPDRPTSALSGGELQLLAVAGALAMGPGLLLLDEPVSMLDAPAAQRVVDAVRQLGRGTTLVVVDHRPAHWLDVVDRMLVLDSTGRAVADGPASRVLVEQRDSLRRLGVWLPDGPPQPSGRGAPMRTGSLAASAAQPPVPATGRQPTSDALLTLRDVVVRRRGHGPLPLRAAPSSRPAVDGVTLDVPCRQPTALVGRPGAGKSTLLAVAAGLLAPTSGTARLAGEPRPLSRLRARDLAARVAWIPQRPDHGFVTHRVRDEVLATPRALDRRAPEAEELLERLGLSSLADADPRSLSGGEARRLVVAAALAAGPELVCADEPTVGLDRHTWDAVSGLLAEHAETGALLLATHDEQLVTAVARRRLVVREGRVVEDAGVSP